MTDRSNKPSQRRPGGIAGHVRPERPVTIAGIRTRPCEGLDGENGVVNCQDTGKPALLHLVRSRSVSRVFERVSTACSARIFADNVRNQGHRWVQCAARPSQARVWRTTNHSSDRDDVGRCISLRLGAIAALTDYDHSVRHYEVLDIVSAD